MIAIFCPNGQCGERLGTVALTALERQRHAVWRIEPGWQFSDTGHLGLGVLERTDTTFASERQLYEHITGRARAMQGVGVVREVDLPIVVRCPKCRRPRWVAPDVLFALAR